MENILRELIALEQKAKVIVAPVENELADLDNLIKSKAAEILYEIDRNVSTKTAQMRADSVSYIDVKKAEIDNEMNAQLSKIEEDWNLNADKWKYEILSKILNLECL